MRSGGTAVTTILIILVDLLDALGGLGGAGDRELNLVLAHVHQLLLVLEQVPAVQHADVLQDKRVVPSELLLLGQ